VYLSEPFGYASHYSVPFDDFEILMPWMMNMNEVVVNVEGRESRIKANSFDLKRLPRIKEIRYIEKNNNIQGMRIVYKVPRPEKPDDEEKMVTITTKWRGNKLSEDDEFAIFNPKDKDYDINNETGLKRIVLADGENITKFDTQRNEFIGFKFWTSL
jgi:hypothetical protein